MDGAVGLAPFQIPVHTNARGSHKTPQAGPFRALQGTNVGLGAGRTADPNLQLQAPWQKLSALKFFSGGKKGIISHPRSSGAHFPLVTNAVPSLCTSALLMVLRQAGQARPYCVSNLFCPQHHLGHILPLGFPPVVVPLNLAHWVPTSHSNTSLSEGTVFGPPPGMEAPGNPEHPQVWVGVGGGVAQSQGSLA